MKSHSIFYLLCWHTLPSFPTFFRVLSQQLSSSPEEKTEVDTFNSSLASLISSGELLHHIDLQCLTYITENRLLFDWKIIG